MKKNLFKIFLAALTVTLSAVSCSKDDNPKDQDNQGKVIVINQGNYSDQSGSISLYDENTNAITNHIYETANGVSIGAIIISGCITPDKTAALVCNYPDKIIFINPATGADTGTSITDGLVSPRNIAIGKNYTYVTNWGATHIVTETGTWEFNKSYIAIYDNLTLTLQKEVVVGSDAEGILINDDRLYVAVKEGVVVYDIDGKNIEKVGVVKPSGYTSGARYIVSDGMSKIWASFPGDGIARINPTSLEVMSKVDVPVDSMDGYITSDSDGENIYTYYTIFDATYTAKEAHIYKVNIYNNNITDLYTGTYFYGAGVSPVTGNIFTAEVSFTSNSVLKVVASSDGTIRNSATAAIGTCRYLFF